MHLQNRDMKKNNKILFCGTMVPEETEYQVKDISAAGNRFQNNMIKNLKRAGYEVDSCSFLGMEIPAAVKQRLHGNYIFRDRNLIRGIVDFHRLLKGRMSDTDIVICYNIAYAWLFLPFMAKKRNKCNTVIVADYSEGKSYGSIGRKLYAHFQLWSMRQFDTVIGLSSNIKDRLRKRQHFILMEGGIDEELYDSFEYKPHQKKMPFTFMYSGLLNYVTGINMLLDAVKQIERPDIRMLISGKGELEEAIREIMKEDERICYLGHLSYDEYVEKLSEADVLINPRDMNLPENQNNFPSKIMDYLAAGKPIISTKFVGWEKFKENIIFCESSVYELRECMKSVIVDSGDRETVFHLNREKAKQFEWGTQLKRIFEQKNG